MDIKSFYNYQEHRGQSGYGASILVKEQTADKYSLLIASQSVPAVFGSQNSFEFDLLNSPVTGKIAGKISLDDKEINDVLLHRDNVWRFQQLKGKVLDFLYMTPDFVGWHFTGTVSFKPNDASADVLTGTYTIVPMSADDDPILDCRGDVQETLCFAEVVPENIKIGDKINVSLVQSTLSSSSGGLTYKVFEISKNGTKGTENTVSPDSSGYIAFASATATNATVATANKLYGITASATGYASWTTTVYVNAAS